MSCSIAIVHPRLAPTEPPAYTCGEVGLARDAQLQRRQQAEGGVKLREVAGEMHGREYSGFGKGMQYFSRWSGAALLLGTIGLHRGIQFELELTRPRAASKIWFCIDLLPSFSASLNEVKSVFEKENGLEEAIYGRTDHWFF